MVDTDNHRGVAKRLESAPSNEVAFMLEPASTPAPTPVSDPTPAPNFARFDVGSGGIHLYPATVLKISADDPLAGKIFERWTGGCGGPCLRK